MIFFFHLFYHLRTLSPPPRWESIASLCIYIHIYPAVFCCCYNCPLFYPPPPRRSFTPQSQTVTTLSYANETILLGCFGIEVFPSLWTVRSIHICRWGGGVRWGGMRSVVGKEGRRDDERGGKARPPLLHVSSAPYLEGTATPKKRGGRGRQGRVGRRVFFNSRGLCFPLFLSYPCVLIQRQSQRGHLQCQIKSIVVVFFGSLFYSL